MANHAATHVLRTETIEPQCCRTPRPATQFNLRSSRFDVVRGDVAETKYAPCVMLNSKAGHAVAAIANRCARSAAGG
jgi:hypothetical protein